MIPGCHHPACAAVFTCMSRCNGQRDSRIGQDFKRQTILNVAVQHSSKKQFHGRSAAAPSRQLPAPAVRWRRLAGAGRCGECRTRRAGGLRKGRAVRGKLWDVRVLAASANSRPCRLVIVPPVRKALCYLLTLSAVCWECLGGILPNRLLTAAPRRCVPAAGGRALGLSRQRCGALQNTDPYQLQPKHILL